MLFTGELYLRTKHTNQYKFAVCIYRKLNLASQLFAAKAKAAIIRPFVDLAWFASWWENPRLS